MKGIDPITLDLYELNRWIEMDIDNIVIFLIDGSNRKPYLLKKSYFISPLINNIYKECIINNNQINITETTNKSNLNYRNLGFYLGSPLLVENKDFVKTLNKKSNKVFEIQGNINFGSKYINLEYLELSQISLLKKNDKIIKKNFPDKIDIYFDSLTNLALRNYSYQWDQAINLYLRRGEEYWNSNYFNQYYSRYGSTKQEAIDNVKDKIKFIDKCFLEFAPRADKREFYWRGQKQPFLSESGQNIKNIGDKTIAKNFISVSESKEIAEGFKGGKTTNCCLYKIMLQKGIPHINMKRATQYDFEKEILLPRNLIYTLIDKQQETINLPPHWNQTKTQIIAPKIKQDIYILQASMIDQNQFDIPTNCKVMKVGKLNPINIKLKKQLEILKELEKENNDRREVLDSDSVGPAPNIKLPRCPNKTHRNKKTGNCEPKKKLPRCPNGTRRNKKTGNCEPKK